jgi:hypothetical protein
MDIKQLVELANKLFSDKLSLTSLHQELADQFYPERADFTVQRSIGTDFAANLMSSYPITCRRELANQFSTMLRPTATPWFHQRRKYITKAGEDIEVRQKLEEMERVQRRVMYDSGAMFTRATKEGDHDFACFGQTVISVEPNKLHNGLLFRSWHLRDVAWQENEEGNIGFVARKWKPTALTLKRTFGDKIHQKVSEAVQKEPFERWDVMHLVVEADMYDDTAPRGMPRWSLYYDVQNQHLIMATPLWNKHYVIPRWQTVSGSQYSYSPATVCALPDARLLQAMTYTLLEAGEKATNPPLIATKGVVRSDMGLFAGGVTWVDQDYDERLGEALRPLTQDFRGFNFGVELNQDTRALLHKAFFLDALTPFAQANKDETAYEVSQRVQKWIRDALPIFEPVEQEYNAALCNEAFDLILHMGGFGSPMDFPRKLSNAEIEFDFESPLHDLIDQKKGQIFLTSSQLIAQAVALDPGVVALPKVEVMLRDALLGNGVPADWLNTEAEVQRQKDKMAQQQAQQAQLANMEQASNAVKNLGAAGVLPQGGAPGGAPPV